PRRFQEIELMAQIEARGRLVQHEQAGAMDGLAASELHQHASKMRTLLLAARERGDDALAKRREIDLRKRAGDERVAATAVARAHAHPVGDREWKGHGRMLR